MGRNATVKCLDCDTLIDPSPSGRGPRRQRCSVHRALRKAQLQRARTAQLRAEGYGVVADLVIAQEVFERDNWLCHLCGRSVPKRLRKPGFRAGAYEPQYPVVDHVIPLYKGGPHTMDNCRLAHWTCNAKKHINDGLSGPEFERVPVARNPTGNPCSVQGCFETVSFKGMCGRHYSRNNRLGHPLKVKCGCGCGELVLVDASWTGLFYIDGHGVQNNVTDPAEKLRQNQATQPVSDRGRDLYGLTDDCIIWTGTLTNKGYGIINIRAGKRVMRSKLVHRFAYEMEYGEGSAVGLTIDHLCGVPACCNTNHLQAVTLAVNLRRAARAVTACPQGHDYDERNTLYTPAGHRICRQCNRNKYHRKEFGHDFVYDPENTSTKRERCLTCRLKAESTPQFCPHGHEYTPENTRLDGRGNRYCIQCGLDRRHVEQFGHEFVIDPSNPSEKRRRCLICFQTPVTHCVRGHEYNELNLELSRKGHRKCVQCRLDKVHVPQYGHEFIIDPIYKPGTKRLCTVCEAKKKDTPPRTLCPKGHEFTPLTLEFHSTRGHRVCVQCRLDAAHIPNYGHSFDIDPEHTGKLRRCLICLVAKQSSSPPKH